MKLTARIPLAVCADVWILFNARPDWTSLGRGLVAPHRWLSLEGTNRAVAQLVGAGLWLAACWFGIGLLAMAASWLPGRCGLAASTVSRRLLPGALRQFVAGAAGISIALSGGAAFAAAPSSPSSGSGQPGASMAAPGWPVDPAGPVTAAPMWPTDAPPPATSLPPATTTPPATSAPPATSRPATDLPPATSTSPLSSSPPPTSPPLATSPPSQPVASAPPSISVTAPRLTVHAGDSLWLIAAHRLAAGASPGEISAEWHRWYAANLALIGDDPDLIRPGTTLTAPTAGEQR